MTRPRVNNFNKINKIGLIQISKQFYLQNLDKDKKITFKIIKKILKQILKLYRSIINNRKVRVKFLKILCNNIKIFKHKVLKILLKIKIR